MDSITGMDLNFTGTDLFLNLFLISNLSDPFHLGLINFKSCFFMNSYAFMFIKQ